MLNYVVNYRILQPIVLMPMAILSVANHSETQMTALNSFK